MDGIHASFESVLFKLVAAEKESCCDLRSFIFTHMRDILTDVPFLVAFRDKLSYREEYEWCASVQQLINSLQTAPDGI